MDLKDIYKIIDKFDDSKLTHLELSHDKTNLVLKREEHVVMPMQDVSQLPVAQGIAPIDASTTEQQLDGHVVPSPLVGVFYESPSPEKGAFVKAGDMVEEGQVLCIIEAMKTMNEIIAPTTGKIAEVLVKNEAVVAYDTPLFLIKE